MKNRWCLVQLIKKRRSFKVFAQCNHIISKSIQTCKKYSDTHCYKQYYTNRRIKRLSQSIKKRAKDYIGNYYGPSNKRHQISFFVNDTCSDSQCTFVVDTPLYTLLYTFQQIAELLILLKGNFEHKLCFIILGS